VKKQSSTVGEFFSGFSLENFWNEDAGDDYKEKPFTDKDLEKVEKELGYKLPGSYVALMRLHNGGAPKKTGHRTATRTSWSNHGVAIHGIFGIGDEAENSLCGESGSKFWESEEWEYPKIGIYFADCPSGGHDMLAMDYTKCGPKGEPTIVHVDQEVDFKVTHVADNFEAFIRGLIDAEELGGDGDGDDGGSGDGDGEGSDGKGSEEEEESSPEVENDNGSDYDEEEKPKKGRGAPKKAKEQPKGKKRGRDESEEDGDDDDEYDDDTPKKAAKKSKK